MSPKSLDPISRRPKPEEEQPAKTKAASSSAQKSPEAGYIPREELLVAAQKKIQERKQAKSKRLVITILALIVLTIGLVAGTVYIFQRNPEYLKSLFKPKPTKGVFADIDGKTYSTDDYNAVVSQYLAANKKTNPKATEDAAKQRASKDITDYLALESEAVKHSIVCTDQIVDARMSSRYQSRGGKDKFYAYIKSEYGLDARAIKLQQCNDYYRNELKQFISGVDVFGVYIRWDVMRGKPKDQQVAYEQAATAKLQNDFTPLLSGKVSADEIERRVDIGKYTTGSTFDQLMKTPEKPYVRSIRYGRFNNEFYRGFQKYDEGEDDSKYLNNLQVGETTPVYKSKTGYIAVFRAESRTQGDFESIDAMIAAKIANAKLSSDYYAAPNNTPDTGPNIYDKVQQQFSPSSQPQSNANPLSQSAIALDKLKNWLVPTARAGNILCYSGTHALPFSVRYFDYDTWQPIDMSNSNTSLGITSTGDMTSNTCLDPWPGNWNGFLGVMYSGYTNLGQLALIHYPYRFQQWDYSLSCYTAWRYVFNPPEGYQPLDYTNASQFYVAVDNDTQTQAWTGTSTNPGETTDHFRIPDWLYHGVANGARGYTISVFFKRSAPPPPPTYNVSGAKYDRYLRPWDGGYSSAVVQDTATGASSNAQGYAINGLTVSDTHGIVASNTNEWVATGFRYNGTQYGTPAAFGIPGGSAPANSNVNIDFLYEPKPSTIQTGILVRDPVDGKLKNPCTVSGTLSYLCDNPAAITTTRNFNLPNGLVNSYNSTVTNTTTPNRGNGGIYSLGNLYANSTVGNPAAAGYRANIGTLPAGYRVAGTVSCPENTNPADCFNNVSAGGASSQINISLSASSWRPVYFILEQVPFQLRVVKRAPGTFANGNSDTQDLTYGKITLNNSTVLSNDGGGWNWTQLLYNGGTQTLRADAPAGWQIRGYSYCIGQAWNQPTCDVGAGNDISQAPGAQDQSNGTMARIITQNNGQQSLELQINTSGLKPTFNGRTIDPALWNQNELYIAFYFKPAPVKYQARSLINREGPDVGYKTNLNPCSIANTSDYKYQELCRNVEFRAVRNVLQPTGPVSRNYVPTLPGYGYSVAGSHNQTTGNCSAGSPNSCSAGASDWIKPGKRLIGPANAVDDATAQSENLAIFDNLYPGNYVIQYNNNSFPSKTSWGDLSYSVRTSNCDDGSSNCSDTKSKRVLFGYCPINFAFGPSDAPAYANKDDYLPGELRWYGNCRNDFGSPQEGINGISATPNTNQLQQYGSPIDIPLLGIKKNFFINDPPAYCVGGFFLIWCTGYWVDPPPQAQNPNSQDYSYYTEDRTLNVNLKNGYAEANFMWTPRPEITNVDISCEKITANIVYSPDPGRNVRTYITLDDKEVRNPDGTRVEATSRQGVPAVFNIPTRQFYAPSDTGNATVWKDGLAHRLKFWSIYEDGDLQSPTRESVTTSGQARKYDPVNPHIRYSDAVKPDPSTGNYTYRCQNQATCDVGAFKAATDNFTVLDSGSTLNVTVTMKNTGQSYWWQQKITGNAAEKTGPIAVDTKHQLGAGAGMRLSTDYGDYGWQFSRMSLDNANNTPGSSSSANYVQPTYLSAGQDTVTFTFKVKAPQGAVDGSTLSFAMYRDGQRFGLEGGDPPSIECSTQVRIRGNFAPWLRVQNGDVSALGIIQNQPEKARGTYKAQNNDTPTVNPNSNNGLGWFDSTKTLYDLNPGQFPKVASINQHAQNVIAAALNGNNNFCSSNWYTLGTNTVSTSQISLFSRNCDAFDAAAFNLEKGIKDDFATADNQDNIIFNSAANSFLNNGQCDDSGTTADKDGPDELNPLAKYYRSWAPAQPGLGIPARPVDSHSLIIDKPMFEANGTDNGSWFGRYANGALKLVNIQNNDPNLPPTQTYSRPCPTLYQMQYKNADGKYQLGELDNADNPKAITIGAGRATLVVNGDLIIKSNIRNDFSVGQTFDFKQETTGNPNEPRVIDIAALNKLPNLGIMVNGNITIDDKVTDIQAHMFATGRLITCQSYALTGGIDTNTGNDVGGSTGTLKLYPQNISPTSTDPLAKLPPAQDNPTAAKCSNALTIRGSVAASGFTLGRNYLDFTRMVSNFAFGASVTAKIYTGLNYLTPINITSLAQNSPNKKVFQSGPSPISLRKFCNTATDPLVAVSCVDPDTGKRVDFDAPGNYTLNSQEQNYLRINGYPQSNYFGGPAEDFIGSGISTVLPPAGFENIATDSYSRPKYVIQNAKPRF